MIGPRRRRRGEGDDRAIAAQLGRDVSRESATYRRVHGDAMLWVGCHGDITRTVRGCMVRNRLFASEIQGGGPDDLSSLCCALEALPLPNNSLDAMVLHHALEVSADARSGLREAARVLVPGGRLVICGFNPMSLWGLRRLYAQVSDDAFTGTHWVTAVRLLDWARQYRAHSIMSLARTRTPASTPRRPGG